MKITSVETYLVNVPQKYPIVPYQSRVAVGSSTGALLVRIETDEAVFGWGEAPQLITGDRLTGDETDRIRDRIMGRDPTAIEALYADWGLGELEPDRVEKRIQSAVEMAMWDILGKVCRQPVYRLLGGLYRREVELAACMGIRPPDEAGEIARLYVQMGFSTLKTKAGRDPEEDLAMVRGIRDAVGDQLELRIDPNRGYSPDVCLQLARDLEQYNLQYLEQPMPEDLIDKSAEIRQKTKTPLALNESVTTLERVRTILNAEAADVLLPDTHQCGGMWAVKLVAELAASAGVPCVFHCCHDLGPKTAAMLHLVASTPNFTLANDCTYYGLADHVIVTPFEIDNGRIRVPDKPGLGIEVDPNKVRKYRAGRSG